MEKILKQGFEIAGGQILGTPVDIERGGDTVPKPSFQPDRFGFGLVEAVFPDFQGEFITAMTEVEFGQLVE